MEKSFCSNNYKLTDFAPSVLRSTDFVGNSISYILSIHNFLHKINNFKNKCKKFKKRDFTLFIHFKKNAKGNFWCEYYSDTTTFGIPMYFP